MNIIALSSFHRGKVRFIFCARVATATLILPALLALAGCQTPPAGNHRSVPPVAFASEPATLREGDTLKISFPGAPNLDTTQPVRSDGKIILPIVGEMSVLGMTPAALEKNLIQRYSSQLLSKEVTVAVEPAPFVVYVTGAVLRPGKVTSSHPLSALQAIMEAGGFDYAKANQKAVKIIHHDETGAAKSSTVNLKLEMQGKSGAAVALKPSDIVFVPEQFTWF